MASDEFTTPSPSRRGEVDTSLPYEHVSEAVTMFGSRMQQYNSPNKIASPEKRSESPVFPSLKDQISQAEASRNKLEAENAAMKEEIAKLRNSYGDLEKKLEEASKSSESAQVKEAELKGIYSKVVEDVQAAKLIIEKLQNESASDREYARKQVEDIEAKAEELSKELEAATKAREEAQGKQVSSQEQVEKLRMEYESLKNELDGYIAAEGKMKEEVAKVVKELEDANGEIQALKSKASASLAETLAEMEVIKKRLKEAEDERAALLATKAYLEAELESSKEQKLQQETELENGDKQVEILEAKAAALKSSEDKVAGTEHVTEEVFERALAELIEADVVNLALGEIVDKSKAEMSETLLATEKAEEQAAKCLDEARKAKASESQVLEKICTVDGGEDSEFVIKRLAEMEEETQQRVASEMAEVENIRVNEAELEKQLAEARTEIEAVKEEARVFQERAGNAEAAKAAVEGKLRKLRGEAEQRRKLAATNTSTSEPTVTNTNTNTNTNTTGNGVVFGGGTMDLMSGGGAKVADGGPRRKSSAESLGEILKIKPSSEQDTVLAVNSKKKKKQLLARLGAVFRLRNKS